MSDEVSQCSAQLCCYFQDALLAFREKLSEQLSMIEEAQLKKAGQP